MNSKRIVMMLVLMAVVGGCQQYQLQPADYWGIAAQSHTTAMQAIVVLIDAGEIDRDEAVQIKEYNDLAKLALDQWYESIINEEPAADAIGRFNQSMAGLMAAQRKEQ